MRGLGFWLVLTVLLAALILVPFVLFEADIVAAVESFRASTPARIYVAAFVVGALLVDVALPVPSTIVITFGGATLGVTAGTACAWLGMTAGCLLAYWLGRRGQAAFARSPRMQAAIDQAQAMAQRYGVLMVVLARPVPVLAEITAVYAGMVRLPWRTFVGWSSLANLGVAVLYASLGAWGRDRDEFVWAFGASLALPGLVWAVMKARAKV